MPWPDDDTDLPVEILAAFGADLTADPDTWSWTNLTTRLLRTSLIRLSGGRRDGARQVSTGTTSALLLNDDGALMPESPVATYWPNVVMNTPIWLRLDPTDIGLPSVPGTYYDLAAGYADDWDPTIIPGSDGEAASQVALTASGIMRRLSQGARPLASALSRAIVVADPIAYWSMEDGSDSTEAVSALPDQPSLVTLGSVAPQFGAADGPPGSDSLPDLTSHGVLTGRVPIYAHTGEWQVEWWFQTDTGDSLDFTASVPLQWDTPDGSVVAWDMLLFVGRGATNPGLGLIRIDVGGYVAPPGGGEPGESQRLADPGEYIEATIPSVQGQWHQARICARQASGTTIQLTAYINNTQVGTITFALFAGPATLGPVTRVTVNPLQGSGAYAGVDGVGLASVGHVAVYDTIADPGTFSPGMGYPGEAASTRIARLCAEEGVPAVVDAGTSEPMGAQRPGNTLLDLLRQCEAADMGILSEHRWGLRYRPRDTRYNQGVALNVDLSTYQHDGGTDPASVLTPKFDDALVRNDWTVSRTEGSRGVTVVDLVDIARRGRYDDATELNVATDGVLGSQAGWRVWLGTFVTRRYPSWPLDLAGNPEYIADWMALQLGDRARRTNPPAPHPPGVIDTIVEGWSATIGPRSWMVTPSGGPYQPWRVAEVDDDPRVAADGSALAAALTSTGTSARLLSTIENGPWITGTSVTNTTDFPLFINVGGEMVYLSGIAAALTDTFTRTVASGFGTATTGQAWTVVGTASEYNVVGGATARMTTGTVNVLLIAHLDSGATDIIVQGTVSIPVVPTGAGISARVIGRMTDTGNYYEAILTVGLSGATTLMISRRVAGVGTTVVSAVSVGTHSAGNAWTIRLQVVGPRMAAKAWRVLDPEPSGYQLFGFDSSLTTGSRVGLATRRETGNTNGSTNIDWDDLSAPTLQVCTVADRSVNGVIKSHSAGAPVDVWEPAIVPL